MKTILVTGYGGFLGEAICRQLLDSGYRVRGLARKAYPELSRLGIDGIQGDATSKEICLRASRGIDGVIHTAAIAGVWGKRKTFESINVGATLHLLEAAKRYSIRAFVYCSSPSVTFDGSPQKGIDESAPYPTRWLCDYPRTKAIAEQAVLAADDRRQLWTCSLRPHLIWGEGDPHLIPRLIDRCRSGRLRCVGDGQNLIDTVHVDNAARAHVLALERLLGGDDEVAGRPFFVTDGQPIACWEWIQQILHGAGLNAPTRRISLAAAYRIGGLLEFAYGLLRLPQEPPMTRFVAAQLGVDHYFSIEAARRLLDYQPSIDRERLLASMQPWLRSLS